MVNQIYPLRITSLDSVVFHRNIVTTHTCQKSLLLWSRGGLVNFPSHDCLTRWGYYIIQCTSSTPRNWPLFHRQLTAQVCQWLPIKVAVVAVAIKDEDLQFSFLIQHTSLFGYSALLSLPKQCLYLYFFCRKKKALRKELFSIHVFWAQEDKYRKLPQKNTIFSTFLG